MERRQLAATVVPIWSVPAWFYTTKKGELIGPVVHNGRVDRGMPQFASFSNTELYELAEFLHMRVELAANRGTYRIMEVAHG